jgi:hypothetical protein
MPVNGKQQENGDKMEDEVAPVADPEVMTVDEPKTEVPVTEMVKGLLNVKYFSLFFILLGTRNNTG